MNALALNSVPVHQPPIPRAVRVVPQELHCQVVLDSFKNGHTMQVPQVLVMILVSLTYLELN